MHNTLWGYVGGNKVLINVLHQRIPYLSQGKDLTKNYDTLSDEQRKQLTEKIKLQVEKEWIEKGWKGENFEKPGMADAIWMRVWYSISEMPFWYGDEIEVVVRHSVTVLLKKEYLQPKFRYSYTEDAPEEEISHMLFVDVLRNLSRPQVVYPKRR